MSDDPASVLCPECGEDVCTTRDTARGWTHRSRVIPRILWAVLCLGLIGYWVSIGQWSFVQGERRLNLPQPYTGSVGQIFTSLNPFNISDQTTTYLSTQDMRDAIDGDEDALNKARDKFGGAHANNQADTFGGSLIHTVVFGWKEPYGSISSNRGTNFGGVLFLHQYSAKLKDVRDTNSIGHNQYRWSWGEGGWSVFPQLGHTNITHDGAVIRSWSVNLIKLFGVLSVCLVLAWIVVLVGVRLGVSAVRKRSLQAALYLTLLVLAGFLGSSNVSFFDRVQSNHSQDVAQSQAYQVDELIQVASDDSALIALCQELLDLVPVQETDLLLSQAWTFTPSPVNKWTKPTTDRLHVSIGYQGMLVSYEKRVYQVRDGETIPARHRKPFWDGIRDFGIVAAHWGPIENQKSLSVGLFHLLSIGVLFWLAWRVLHWGARMVLVLVQKRRVMRNQCVYCAYPLTQEATQARYPEAGS